MSAVTFIMFTLTVLRVVMLQLGAPSLKSPHVHCPFAF